MKKLGIFATILFMLTSPAFAEQWVLKMNNAHGCMVLRAGEATGSNEFYNEMGAYPDLKTACEGANSRTDLTGSSNLKCHHFDNASVARCKDAGVSSLPGM